MQLGKPMGHIGAHNAKDHLQRLKKAGNPGPLVQYEGLKGEHSKKYHQQFKKLTQQGVGVDVAKRKVALATKQHVQNMFG